MAGEGRRRWRVWLWWLAMLAMLAGYVLWFQALWLSNMRRDFVIEIMVGLVVQALYTIEQYVKLLPRRQSSELLPD